MRYSVSEISRRGQNAEGGQLGVGGDGKVKKG